MDRASLIPLVERQNQGFLAVVDSDGLFKQAGHSAGSQEYTEYVKNPCQQIAARFLLFIKFGPLVDPGESTPADKLLLSVHIK